MRKLYLGRGPRDEVHQGLQGNTLIVAQPSARFTEIIPNVHRCCSSLVLLFCKSVDDVRNAHALVVQREQYKECMQRRIHVCSTFADVVLSDNAMNQDLPSNDVPQAFIDSAIAMPEMATMRTTMDGPASRSSQFGPNPQEDDSDAEDEDDANNDGDKSNSADTTNACPSRAKPPADDNTVTDGSNEFELLVLIPLLICPKWIW
jgi:hypothetical protein